MGKKSKKLNPKRRPATHADIKRAKSQTEKKTIKLAWAIMFSVLVDKEGMDDESLLRIWKGVENLSDSIDKGYVNLADLMNTLKEERGINLID